MKLETAGGGSIHNPTENDIRDAFRDDEERGEFIILSQSDEVFMQAAGEGTTFDTLEYRDGDEDRHYQAKNITHKKDVEQAFRWYLTGDERWKTEYPWTKLDMNRESKPWWKFW